MFIADLLTQAAIPFEENVDLSKYSSFRLGGPARFFARPHTLKQFMALQQLILANQIAFFFLGGGSNILISDQGFTGIVIYLDYNEEYTILKQTAEQLEVMANANVRAPWFAKKISALGYSGLEFLTTIPGQLGGAIIQNAGCYGWELKDIISSVEVIEKGSCITYQKEECNFTYRSSRFKDNPLTWVNKAHFTLPADRAKLIAERIEDYRQRRISSQPKNRRSAGSIFKNPPPEKSHLKAWQLIEKVGLRGVKQNNVEISVEHCNFIVNHGHGSAQDVYSLILLIEEKVKKELNVDLEREVILVGEF